ncbi:MAG TPA: AgmX/PglI C-terminal domain-containing protein [Polyangiaceae bacterium]|nr:AgmX/PglI C-terminal domain-containing protein [Polyangiaceae bacterium]
MPESIAPSSPPPKSSGGAIYIIAVIVLVAAIGGLVCWKLKGTSEPPVATLPPPTVATAPTLVEAPPPPPPEEDAAAPVVDSGGVRVATTNYTPCSNKCSGSGNSAMNSALSARAGSARPCYERALRVNSALQGKLTVSVRIDPQGNVCGASIAQDAIHSAEVSNCVIGMFRSAKFPPPTGGCVEAQVPLSFVPREGK